MHAPIPPRLIERLLLAPIVVLGAGRAFFYLVYAWNRLPGPIDLLHPEAHMVLLAWRAQAGLRLYPDWRDYPHVTNFFAPGYFGLVGLFGAATGADLPHLFLIGRAVNFLCGLLTSLILGIYLGRRHGVGAGLVGGIVSLGAGPMLLYSVMARPDMMAELCGVAGFLLVGDRSSWRHRAGCALLVLAIFTKQPAGIFLLAGAMALFLVKQHRQAVEVLGAGLAALAIVAATTLLLEPNFADSFLGEARTPIDRAGWISTLGRLVTNDPDLLLFAALGLVVGSLGPLREVKLMPLAVVVLVAGLITSRKYGADVNYFLSLRVVEALTLGMLWRAVAVGRAWQVVPLAVFAIAGARAIWPSLEHVHAEAMITSAPADSRRALPDRSGLPTCRAIARMARDPDLHLLTDVGLFDLYQGGRAAFGNPWLFRMLVRTGQVRPVKMQDWIERENYDIIITIYGLDSPGYAANIFGLPMSLVDRARAHYTLFGRKDGFYFYVGRRGPPAPLRSLLEPSPGTTEGDGSAGPDTSPPR